MGRYQLFKRVDFFSQPFQFFVEEKSSKKQTIFGGVLSILTILISLVYLAYLLYLYFDNQLLPNITSQMHNKTTQVSKIFNKSLFGFTFYSQNQTMDQLFQQTGKIFLTFQLQYFSYQQNQEESVDLNFVDCDDDQNFDGFKCIDYKVIDDQSKVLYLDPINFSQSLFSLTVQPCTNLPNCADPKEIYNYIMQNSFQFVIKVRVSQFNEKTRQMEETFLLEQIQFDDNLSLQNQYILQLQQTTITSGLLFQDSNTTIDVISYKRLTTYYTQDNLLVKSGFTGYGSFQFQLDQIQGINKIQYPLITQVLAQFLPVLNVLLTLGFIGKLFAESKIVQDVNHIYLKEYYKNTAIKLIQAQNKDLFQTQGTKDEQIKFLYKNIKEHKQFKKVEEKPKISFKQKFSNLIHKMFKKKKVEQKKQAQKNLYKLIKSKTMKNINIYQLYKDILELKMAIRLLMSPEQYAAMQFCGCEINLKMQPEQNDKIDSNKSKEFIKIKFDFCIQNKIQFVKNIIKSYLELKVKENVIDEKKQQPPLPQNEHLEDQINEQIMDMLEYKESNAQVVKTNKKVHTVFNRNKTKSNLEEILQDEEDIYSHRQGNLIEKPDQIQQPSLNKLQTNTQNHLQVIEDMLSSTDNLFIFLKKFIEKVNDPDQKLSQADLNIYSSLIGLNQNINLPQKIQFELPE
ncbi:hypothetical protein ABPG74_020281 [Tetrahymena malaccensis]